MKRFIFFSLIPPFFLDAVVAITILTTTPEGKPEFKGVSTGFIYGHFLKKVSETHSQYNTYLITNSHVFNELEEKKVTTVFLRFNPEGDEPARSYPASLNAEGNRVWHPHPCGEIDVALMPLDANILEQDRIRFSFFKSESDALDLKQAAKIGLSEGDGVFVLGYPMNLLV
jgi:hypothetical protein